jgi:hypothetical protein
MNEAGTRAGHIDPALKAAGWGMVEGRCIRREFPIVPGRIEGHVKRGKPFRPSVFAPSAPLRGYLSRRC